MYSLEYFIPKWSFLYWYATLRSMSIWKQKFDTETAAGRSKDTMIEYLGIEFLEVGTDYMKARMPVDHRTHQPLGIMHGGASCVLAETIGSTAANYRITDIECRSVSSND